MSVVRTDPVELAPHGGGVTVRPPRLLVVNQRYAGTLDESLGVDRVRQLLADGVLERPEAPCAVVYRVSTGQHEQTGVVVEASVRDYRDGRIRRHEATQPERERRLAEFTETAGVERIPVTLTHPARAGLRALLAEAAVGEPDVRLAEDGVQHSVWVARDAWLVRSIQDELHGLGALYIADGHHRMAAAQRYAARHAGANPDDPGAFTLAALFPSDEMRILGYPRGVARPAGVSTSRLLGAIGARPEVARIEEFTPPEGTRPGRGVVSMHLDGRWYRLWLRTPRELVRASLDVVALDEGVIAGVFGGAELTPLPGASDAADIVRWCAEHQGIGFRPHPPTVEQVMAVSDAGQVMPPKSTWFAPKATAGLFLRELELAHVP